MKCELMRRKICMASKFRPCKDEDMEELNAISRSTTALNEVVRSGFVKLFVFSIQFSVAGSIKASLAHRRQSAAPLTCDTPEKTTFLRRALGYPLALALRLRVLQIVCGISAMVMGSVAFIEERREFNMGLGIPAGGFSVLAAAVSIHTSRGWAGGGSSTLGGGAAGILWAAAASLLVALVVQCCRTIVNPPGADLQESEAIISARPSPRDLVVIAWVQMALALTTLASAGACARIECAGAS